jgi:hypothetical protein
MVEGALFGDRWQVQIILTHNTGLDVSNAKKKIERSVSSDVHFLAQAPFFFSYRLS